MQSTDTDTQQLLSKEFSFLKGVLNHIQDPVIVKDSSYRIVYLNDAACEFVGFSRESLLSKTDYDFFPKEEADIFRNKDNEVFTTGRGNENVEYLTDAKHKKSVISTKKSLFVDESGDKYLVLVIRDITEIKLTENHLLKSIDQLAEFAYVASHDIKSPLRTIHSFAELLNKKYRDEIPVAAHANIDFILTASLRANNLVKDILAYSTSTSVDEDVEPIELNSIINEVEENMYSLIRENDASIRCVNLPAVMGSKVRLYQLFQNLISNAIKFKKDNVPSIIEITSKRLASSFEIVVEDNGTGIESEYLDNVFNLFTKLNTNKHSEGSGIGLATCKKIAKEMGGNIHLESEYGEGTKVIIFLPMK